MPNSPEPIPTHRIPAGWYPNAQGSVQWWDGQQWASNPISPQTSPQVNSTRKTQTSRPAQRADRAHRVIFQISAWSFVTGFAGVAFFFLGMLFAAPLAMAGIVMMLLGFPTAVVTMVVHLLITAVRM